MNMIHRKSQFPTTNPVLLPWISVLHNACRGPQLSNLDVLVLVDPCRMLAYFRHLGTTPWRACNTAPREGLGAEAAQEG